MLFLQHCSGLSLPACHSVAGFSRRAANRALQALGGKWPRQASTDIAKCWCQRSLIYSLTSVLFAL